eukprot:TRINITY_DN21815_c0_g1_i1.p1 TRINITY_DN21815_c0_g1~~TRINITY_DN21815_c0_g1_i1.p1  ORF type:complete len:210 (+),score=43.79 TRINITY_DN21815_c0_g1_i1:49-678(+)
MMNTIPDWMIGIWERKYIQREGQEKDDKTRVSYIQAGGEGLFCDVRDGEDEMAFSGLTEWKEKDGDLPELHWHAVITTDDSEVCDRKAWEQISDGTHTTPDYGKVKKISADHWMEYGDNYTEEWVRHCPQTGWYAASQPGHVIVSVGPYFAYATNTTTPHSYCFGEVKDMRVTRTLKTSSYKVGDIVSPPSNGWKVSPNGTMPSPFTFC